MPSVQDIPIENGSPIVILRNKKGITSVELELTSLAQIGIKNSNQSNQMTEVKKSSSNGKNSGSDGNGNGNGSREMRRWSKLTPDSVPIKHYDSLICELRCPGCASPLQAPIKLCASGHGVCDRCTVRFPNCPICKKLFTKTRSITLEAIAAKAEFSCTNKLQGCGARLPAELLIGHERRCVYQIGDCFMGKVWGDCEWSGCEINWMEHCLNEHNDKIFFQSSAVIEWQCTYEDRPKPISAYYIFKVFNENFNLYQIWDKPMRRISWTVICASKDPKISKRYAYEIELYSPTNVSRLQIQRHACHAENDEDVLHEGRCATFEMAEVMRFMDAYRVLRYRIKIIPIIQLQEEQEKQQNNEVIMSMTSSISRNRLAIKEAKDKYFEQPTIEKVTKSSADTDGGGSGSSIVRETPPSSNNDGDEDGDDGDDGDDNKSTSNSSFEEIRKQQLLANATGMDSIDKEIITKKDLKQLFAKDFSDIVTAALQAASSTAIVTSNNNPPPSGSNRSSVNSVPKPPRQLSVDVSMAEKTEKIPLIGDLDDNIPPLPESTAPKLEKAIEFAKSNVN